MSSLKISKNKVVGLSYTLKDGDGNILEQVSKDAPLFYLHGFGQLLPTVETVLEGQSSGFTSRLKLDQDSAFGPVNEDLMVAVPKSEFPEDAELEIGMCFNTTGPEGEDMIVEVVGLEGDMVALDGNHPLAGLALDYDLEVISIRDATQEEIEHGHVHGEDDEHDHGEHIH